MQDNQLRKQKTTETAAEETFCNTVLEAVDEGLSSLGASPKEAVYFLLEETFGIRKHEIPARIGEFSDALEQIFGLGAKKLEILFIKRLHTKIKSGYEWDTLEWVTPELTFEGYVHRVKQNFKQVIDDISV